MKIEPLIAVGELDLQVAAAAGGLPLDGARTTVFEDDPDAPQGRREIARSAASHPVFTLLAGSYYVVAQYGGGEIRERFVIRAGERTERTLALGIAQVTVSAKLPGRLDAGAPIQLKLQAAEGAKEIVPARRGTATFDVPAGRYRLEGRIGTGNVQIEKDFELKAGAREQIALELPAGGLKLRLMDTSGAPLADAAWEVRDRAGRLVWAGVESEARPLLLQGRYNVKAEVRNRRVVRDIEVRAGEVRAIDLTGQERGRSPALVV